MTVVSDAFIKLALSEAKFLGIPDLPFVEVVHHPWYSVTDEEWQRDAEDALLEISTKLTSMVGIAP